MDLFGEFMVGFIRDLHDGYNGLHGMYSGFRYPNFAYHPTTWSGDLSKTRFM
jgi:hypothetical protein